MEKFFVEMREVHVQTVSVTAETPMEAIKKVEEGEGDYVTMEYSHTMDSESWSVTNEKGETVLDQYQGEDGD